MSYSTRPNMPAAVRRFLRQEAGFGCARCGHPYVEYHHIVTWAEEEHFRPADMVALCGNCHPAVSKWGRDRQYEIKNNPCNIKSGRAGGALETDKRDLIFKVGGNWYENTAVIIADGSLPVISCRLHEGQALVTLNVRDVLGQPLISMIDNQIDFRVSDLWDFEYSQNKAVARYGPRDVAVELDFTKAEAEIRGSIWLGGQRVRLGSTETVLPGRNVMTGCRTSGCGVGIQFGDPAKPPVQWTLR